MVRHALKKKSRLNKIIMVSVDCKHEVLGMR